MHKFGEALPQGSLRARIRATNGRETRQTTEAELGTALGDEQTGFVMIDLQGHPIKYPRAGARAMLYHSMRSSQINATDRRYDQSKVLTDIVAQRTNTLDLEVQTSEGGTWRRVGRSVSSGGLDLGSSFAVGADKLNKDTYVRNTDKHYDAMLFPHVYPYGTGSQNCEVGTTTLTKYVKNRAVSLQSFFRRSSIWAFFSLDRVMKQRLFFANWAKRRQGMRISALNAGDDNFTKTFGQVVPASIPESTAWWQRRAKELSAMTCDREMGLFQIMVTIT
jgi:hypothetical protein